MTVNILPGRALDEGRIRAIVHLVPARWLVCRRETSRWSNQANVVTHPTSGREINDAQLNMPAMSKAVFSGVLKQSCRLLLVTVISRQVTAQLDFASKEQTEEQYRPNGDESHAALRSRQLNESEQSGSGYPGGVPGALSIQPAPANNAPISTPPANQNNRQQQASTTSNRGPRSAQRNEPVTTKSIAPFVIPK
ncbi:flagellar M-ring protein FliF C-terminal domain-containing protein [Shigella sonnei]